MIKVTVHSADGGFSPKGEFWRRCVTVGEERNKFFAVSRGEGWDVYFVSQKLGTAPTTRQIKDVIANYLKVV